MMQLLQKSEDAVCGWLRGIDAALLRTVTAAAAVCLVLGLFPDRLTALFQSLAAQVL